MTDIPIACTLSPAELSTEADDLLPGLASEAVAITEIRDGTRLSFDSTSVTVARIAHVIDRERRCCRFLQFSLLVQPGEAPLHLDVTGPSGTRELLATLSPAFAVAANPKGR